MKSDCPLWDIYMFKTFEGVEQRKELVLKPVVMYRDPFRRGRNKMVLCELWATMDKPAVVNTRRSCTQLFKEIEEEGVWIEMEQQYFLMGDNRLSLTSDKDPSATNNNFGTEVGMCKSPGFERDLAEMHFQACLYAGLKMYGLKRNDTSNQWEYHIGPCEGVDLAYQIVISRYLLLRIGELFGVEITVTPVVSAENAPNKTLVGYMNFSTTKMRKEGGINTKYINKALEILRTSPQILSRCNLQGGNDNGMDSAGIGENVRIPTLVAIQRKENIQYNGAVEMPLRARTKQYIGTIVCVPLNFIYILKTETDIEILKAVNNTKYSLKFLN
ncbi:hypothetical protein KUTeg_000902 [Tegillarca granosa]|uniref:glutamine synthetase n=1 Tax=Tegillarca granosa TaxID=220873 RepID=A0ABQ9FWD7_TEGGR|nr:hypothetical protein KUTeg_000902 [Tegillarca granosa]